MGAGAEIDFLPAKGVFEAGEGEEEGKAWHWQGFLFLTWSPGAVEEKGGLMATLLRYDRRQQQIIHLGFQMQMHNI